MTATQVESSVLNFRLFLKAFCFFGLFLFGLTSSATVYDIGPGQTYTTISAFPWSSLQAGDTVQIHYASYHETIGITSRGTMTQPIRVVGIPDPSSGNLPIIDGTSAFVGPNLNLQFAHGSAERGLIVISPPGSGPRAGQKPGYIEVANLQVQNAYGGGTSPTHITFADGTNAAYPYNVAGIFIVDGEHITVTNCTITGNSNGFFVASGDSATGGSEAEQSRDITLQYSRLYGNSNDSSSPPSNIAHNAYTEALGIVFQYNYFGASRATATGNELKDRSAGTVIRYNYFETNPAAFMMDLDDPEDDDNVEFVDPTFKQTMVYGNVLHSTGEGTLVHYGGDHGYNDDRTDTLYFYNNTVVLNSDQSAYYQTNIFFLGDNDGSPGGVQTADIRNNIFYNSSVTPGAKPTALNIMKGSGIATLGDNWISPGWFATAGATTSPSVVVAGTLFIDPSNNPSFANLAMLDFHLLSGSNAIDKSMAQNSIVTSNPAGQGYSIVRQYVKDQASQARQVNGAGLDFGAFEAGSAGACTYALNPASTVQQYAGGTSSLEVLADSGCTWTATTSDPWITIISGGTGTGVGNGAGVGNILYSVAANSGSARSGSLSIGGQSFPINQLAYDVTPPTVSVTAPINGANVSGNAVTLTATASDNIGVASVQFTVDGSAIGPVITTPPYTYVWDASGIIPGASHTLSAIAADASLNTSTATPVTINVVGATGGTATSSGASTFVNNYLPATPSTQTGLFTIEADIVPAGDGTTSPQENGLFAVSNGAVSSLGSLAAIVLFDTPGVIEAYNGGAYHSDTPVTYTAGQTYHVRMVVNVPTNTYDVYITPPGSGEIHLAAGYQFRSTAGSLTQLDHWNLVSNGNTIAASNISVTTASQVAPAPLFSPAGGSYGSPQTVTLSTSVPSATIYYTTDGSVPVVGSATYSSPITVSSSESINAIVAATGYSANTLGSAAYVIGATPATSGTAVYNGASPTFVSNFLPSVQSGTFTLQSDVIPLGDGSSLPKENGMFSLSNGSVSSTTGLSATVLFNSDGFIYAMNGAASAYTTAVPYTAGQVYHVRMVVNVSANTYDVYVTSPGASEVQIASAYTFSAVATQLDHWNLVASSNNISAMNVYIGTGVQAATPTFSPVAAAYTTGQTVTMSTTTPSATIYYTTNGSVPTTASTVYTGPISVSSTETVTAIAVASGLVNSTYARAAYDITTVTPTPIFSPAGGTYTTVQTVTITTTAPSATIYYTTDGSTPTTSSTVYTGPLTVASVETIKAIATASGFTTSAVGSAPFSVTPIATNPIMTPPQGTYTSVQTVTVTNTTPGGVVHYTTDGSTWPTILSPAYTGPITISKTEVLWVVTFAPGYTQSPGIYAQYHINLPTVATPVFSPAAGTYTAAQTVAISTTTPSATIYYTTNGAAPTTSSTVYTGPITVSATQTVKALAVASGFNNSAIGSAVYTIHIVVASTPTFSPAAGTYTTAQTVTIGSTTPSATIHYTTNGTTPTSSSPVYSGPITVSTTETVKAFATATGYTDSAVGSAAYTLNTGTPTFSPASGNYTTAQTVVISTVTPSATIHYTVDGTTPTVGSAVYTGPLTVAATETVKAMAMATGFANSAVASATYGIYPSINAPYFVQQCNQYQAYGTTVTCTLTGVGAGHALVISNVYGGTTVPTTTAGTPVLAVVAPDGASSAYILPNVSGGNITITLTTGGPGKLWLSAMEYANVATSPLDGTGTANSGTSSNYTTTQPSDALWTMCTAPGGSPVSAGTAPITWTARTAPSGSGRTVFIEDGFTTAAGTYHGQCTSASDVISLALRAPAPAAATPTFSPAGGTYTSVQTVAISSTTPSSTIYYTTDGTTPTTSSTIYTAPISVSATETVKAIATATGFSSSAVGSAAYTINLAALPPGYLNQCNQYQAYGTVVTCTITGVGSGHALVIGTVYGGTIVPTTTAGTPVLAVTSNSGQLSAFILPNVSGGNITVTLTVPSNGKIWISVMEYANVATSPLDGTGTNTCVGYCGSVSSSTFTTTQSSDTLWSMCGAPGGYITTVGTAPISWTSRPAPSGSGKEVFIEDGLATTAGNYYGQCNMGADIVSLALKHP